MSVILLKISDIIMQIATGIITSKVGVKLDKAISKYSFNFNSKKAYFKRAKSEVLNMPFIFRDMELNVADDYVETNYIELDYDTLSPIQKKNSFHTLKDDIIYRNRAFFFGNAGMGKSTYFRHCAIQIIDNSPDAYFKRDEGIIPVLVPLKNLSSSHKHPLIDYLTTNTIFFGGKKGRKRLKEKLSTGSLFIMLDGYDEIATSDDDLTFIKRELEIIMDSSNNSKILNSSDEKDLYSLFENCTIWLSSRKEFYLLNRLNIKKFAAYNFSDKTGGSKNIIAVGFNGIGSNRILLIKKIFDRYRKNNFFTELLDDEYFLGLINSSANEELKEISYNPLFMTVLCFLYVQKVLAKGSHDIDWKENLNELIENCVRLLIIDKDKYKARGLKRPGRDAFLNRRNKYPEEKFEFLTFIATTTYFDNRSVFTLDYLNKKAKVFFSTNQTPVYKEILHHLNRGVYQGSNIVKQLVDSGLFIIQGRENGERVFDFPHRLFKETLAIIELRKDGKYEEMIDNIGESNYSELVYVFFQNSNKQDKILEKFFELIKEQPDNDSIGLMLLNCLSKKPVDYKKSGDLVLRFTENCIREKVRIRMPRRVIAEILRSDSSKLELNNSSQQFHQIFKDSFKSNDSEVFYMLCNLLAICAPKLFLDFSIRTKYIKNRIPENIFILLRYILECNSNFKIRSLKKYYEQGYGNIVILAVASNIKRFTPNQFIQLNRTFGYKFLIQTFVYHYKLKGNYPFIKGASVLPDICDFILKTKKNLKDESKRLQKLVQLFGKHAYSFIINKYPENIDVKDIKIHHDFYGEPDSHLITQIGDVNVLFDLFFISRNHKLYKILNKNLNSKNFKTRKEHLDSFSKLIQNIDIDKNGIKLQNSKKENPCREIDLFFEGISDTNWSKLSKLDKEPFYNI